MRELGHGQRGSDDKQACEHTLLQSVVIIDGWIVDLNALHVVVCRVIHIKHGACNVWDVLARVTV